MSILFSNLKESRSQLSSEISSVTSLSFLPLKSGHNTSVTHPALMASGNGEHKLVLDSLSLQRKSQFQDCLRNQLLVTGGVALMSFKETSFIFILLMTLPKARTLDFPRIKSFFGLFCFIFISSHRELISHKNYFQTHVYTSSTRFFPLSNPKPGRTMFFFLRLLACTRTGETSPVVCNR